MSLLSVRNMLSLSVVCILMFTISSTRALHGHDDHHPENVNNTYKTGIFDVDGVEGLDGFEAILHFVDLRSEEHPEHDARNLSGHDVDVLVDTWWGRFDCSANVSESHQHSMHSENDEHSICEQCLNETILFTILEADQSQGISEEIFPKLSTVLLFYTLNFKSVCTENIPTYQQIAEQMIASFESSQTWKDEAVEEILLSLSRSYTPVTHSKCFTAHDVEPDVESSSTHQPQGSVESASSLIVTNLILGRCIGKPTAIDKEAFLHEVFEHYGNDHGIITEEGFEKLLADLGIAKEEHEDEDEDHEDDHEHEDDHGHEHGDEHGHEHEHVERRKRHADETGDHEHDDEHDDEHEDEHEDDPLTVEQCFHGEDLLDIYGIDHDMGIDEQAFQELCPALIQQITSGVCQEEEHHDDHGNDAATSKLTLSEVWGYGFLAVFLISLMAFAGVAVLPCLSSSVYEYAIQMLIALAVATLSGDAILHLIPQAVGLHGHGPEPASNGHDDHAHDEEDHGPLSAELAYVWKCLVAYLAIYLFFLFESMVEMCGGAHTHIHMEHNSLQLQDVQAEKGGHTDLASVSPDSISAQELTKAGVEEEVGTHQHSHGCFGKGALPVMVVLGDTLHNFGDGLAIGAAFSHGAASGVSTSIAVLCHELPHELGDFAVLINAGLNVKMALFLNFASALSAFLGLIVGILVSYQTEAREWIFAAAAGMFLYVSLVDMMPELIHHHGSKGQSRSLLFTLQNVGFLLGAVIILVIALYEDSLVVGL